MGRSKRDLTPVGIVLRTPNPLALRGEKVGECGEGNGAGKEEEREGREVGGIFEGVVWMTAFVV